MQEPQRDVDDIRSLALFVGLGAATLVGLLLLATRSAAPVHVEGGPPAGPPISMPAPPPSAHAAPSLQVPPVFVGPHVDIPGPTTVAEDETDPQLQAYQRSFDNGLDAGIAQPFSVGYHRGTLVAAFGVDGVRPGASCEVRVLPVLDSSYNCLVRVMCDDVVLYPDRAQQAGYAPCEVVGHEAVSARDAVSTDGDRELELDVRAHLVQVAEHTRPDEGEREVLSARVRLDS